MNVVDKVLTEWAYRCNKGYPDINDPQDMRILSEIFTELGIVEEADKSESDSEPKQKRQVAAKLPFAQYHGQYVSVQGNDGEKLYVKKEDFDEKTKQVSPDAKYYTLEPKGKGTGAYQNVYKQVPTTSNNSEEPEEVDDDDKRKAQEKTYVAQQLDKAGVKPEIIASTQASDMYRSATSIKDFVSSTNLKKYVDTFRYLYPYQVLKGGKGEFVPFVSIDGARLGGPNEKDITDRDGNVLEVKELAGKGQKREFALASGASIAGSTFLTNLQTFLKAVAPYNDLPHFRGIANLQSYDSINSGYLDDLRDILENFPYTEKDLTAQTDEIKINGKKYSIHKGVPYTVELDDEGNLKPTQNAPLESKVEDINMRKLLKHPWVLKQTSPMRDLEEIRQKYLQSIDYLMLWTSESTAVIINAKDASQTKLIPVNRVATGNLSLNYFVNK